MEIVVQEVAAENTAPIRRPEWLKAKIPSGANYTRVKEIIDGHRLNTVCEEARCPNMGECWHAGTATFMILGDTCTRSCGFCAVKTGRPDDVLDAQPDILNHNMETVRRLYYPVRPQANYDRSLELLGRSKNRGFVTKTGMMLGIGERTEEVLVAMADIRRRGCDILTLGQYLQPTKGHLPVDRFVHPDEFRALKQRGLEMGFRHVESGPLVRSSYHAEQQV
jgi:lipoate synthase